MLLFTHKKKNPTHTLQRCKTASIYNNILDDLQTSYYNMAALKYYRQICIKIYGQRFCSRILYALRPFHMYIIIYQILTWGAHKSSAAAVWPSAKLWFGLPHAYIGYLSI